MVITVQMHVQALLVSQPDLPSAPMRPRVAMPSPVVMMDDERPVVERGQSRGDAERDPAVGPAVVRRADQSADDPADDRAFPRPLRIGPQGGCRQGRAQHNGNAKRDPSD